MTTDSERKVAEYDLQVTEKLIDHLTQEMGPLLRKRDELKRLLSPVHAPVVEVEDEVIEFEEHDLRW